MSDLASFTEGLRAYRQGLYAEAVSTLAALTEHKGLPGRLSRYYTAKCHRAMGIDHLRAGRYLQAGEQLRRASALIGKRADLAEYLQVVYARTGEYERCASEAEAVARARPDSEEAHIRLAQAQWRSGRRPMAIMTLTHALRKHGDHPRLHMDLGLFYASEDDYDRAREHFRKAVECDCNSADGYHYLGLAESACGSFDKAVKAFQRACTLEPQDLMYAYQLCLAAQASAEAGRPVTVALPEEGPSPNHSEIRQLAEYVAGEPDFVEAFLALPPSDVDEELFGVLVSVLRTALAHHPTYADLHYLTSRSLTRMNQLGGALQHARRAVEINPRYAKALLHLAELMVEAGEADDPIDLLRRAIDNGADWPDAHARLGDAYRRAGDVRQARRHYRRALELNDKYDIAARRLASLAA